VNNLLAKGSFRIFVTAAIVSLAASTESLSNHVAGAIADSIGGSLRFKSRECAASRLRTHDSWEQTYVGPIGEGND